MTSLEFEISLQVGLEMLHVITVNLLSFSRGIYYVKISEASLNHFSLKIIYVLQTYTTV